MVEKETKKARDKGQFDFNSLILMLGIMNGKLDEIIRLLTIAERKQKEQNTKSKFPLEQDNYKS